MKAQRTLKPACPSGSGEGGFVLPVTMMVIAALSLWGATFLTMSSTEHTIASNEVSTARAFNIAEAGLERAKARIKNGTEGSLGSFLPGGTPGPNLYTNVSFDGGSYTVVILDDPDAGGDPNVDTNNRVFIRSTGTLLGTAQKRIEALVESSKRPVPRGASEEYTAKYEFEAAGGGSFDGRDWNAPADISACTSVAGCGTLTGGTPTYGAFKNTNTGTFIGLTSGGNMVGTGCLPPACAGTTLATASLKTDTTVPTTSWDSTIDKLKTTPTRSLTLGSSWSGTYTWGTPAAPEITVLNVPGNVNWYSQVTGAGVLIIETPGPPGMNVGFKSNSRLNWQGLVIIRSAGDVDFDHQDSSAWIRIFGQLVNRAAGYAETELLDNSFVKYSSGAMNMALGSPFAVRSWQEVAL